MLQTTLHEQPCQPDLSLEYALSVLCKSLGRFHARQVDVGEVPTRHRTEDIQLRVTASASIEIKLAA